MQVFDLYGVGLRKAFETPNLLKELNLKVSAMICYAVYSKLINIPKSIISCFCCHRCLSSVCVCLKATWCQIAPAIAWSREGLDPWWVYCR